MSRQPHFKPRLPRIWMFSDERLGASFLPALAQLPKGAGLVFRHYQLELCERRALFVRARRIARARRIVIVLAGSDQLASAWRADGSHGRAPHPSRGLRTAPVHNLRELVAAERAGADLLFISPVFVTRSHPGSQPLGRRGFAALANGTKIPAVALGGMTPRRARMLKYAYGWAGIDSWLPARTD